MQELKAHYAIAIVTHNLQQAQRVADKTAFLYVDTSAERRTGYLVEFGDSQQIFNAGKDILRITSVVNSADDMPVGAVYDRADPQIQQSKRRRTFQYGHVRHLKWRRNLK
jgi:hypothetical protein